MSYIVSIVFNIVSNYFYNIVCIVLYTVSTVFTTR